MRRALAPRTRLLAIATALCGVTAVAVAQQRGFRQMAPDPVIDNAPYDGRFTFARLKFTTAPGGFYYMGLPAWAHGYPVAERNLMQILNSLTTLAPHLDSSVVVALDDPELMKYPLAYMAEADYWTMTDKEAAAFREYLQKGGFVIFDDFRDDFRDNYAGWANFEANMKRVMPDARFLEMDLSNPIFHAFFEIPTFDIVPQFYDRGRPVFRGLFEDNDPTKRLMAIVNFNTDVSNFWEFSATGFTPIQESNQAYKLGVNYLMYSMTH